ncbi:Siroheme synthase [compost metagenome]
MITGSTKEGHLSQDLFSAVKTNATVVVLMGFSKLKEIVALYQAHGRGDLPVALIQNGSLSNERIALGTVDTIEEQSKSNLLGVPAVIILGEVVARHQDFHSLMESPEWNTLNVSMK